MENSKQLLSEQPLQIDIVSDVVCPWCVIGYRQLAEALKQTNTPHEIHWHPFELNPNTPPEGQNLREHIMEKYGSTAQDSEESRVRMTAAGAEVGFEFQFTDDTRTYNTFNVHQLLHWADQQGRMHDLKQALFTAHFTNNRNVSDSAVLADIAADIGLDRTEALAVIEDQRFAKDIREAVQRSQEQGIQSVPSVIFNGRHLVSGAQGVENYISILQQLAEMPD
ncbi:DsbA family protein [Psychrobacter sp. LV10R520-6]|uniref:DsbA family oxidoreductase n=1 Tax=Psychrobacter sp. LV10R520-6 TaxID=1415574 RepID=UPI0024C582B0|nr:DsbA family oxidoreductase [Psychrobacter sp. LV10R520-6]SNT69901.1 Predicted dithiol-disulfide isomerase, DsbA family [Psychrobacter sp. LV10R520-6]